MRRRTESRACPRQLALRVLIAGAVATPALTSVGCDDDIIPPVEGRRVTGRVFYDGDAFADYGKPTLEVGVFGVFPPTGAPHGFTVVPNPEFTAEGVPYEIFGIPAYDSYQVVSQITDQADLDSSGGPAGAFPDYCQLNAAEGGPVVVTDDEPTSDIDITLYDVAGTTDPCLTPDTDQPPGCPPQEGRAGLIVNVSSALDPATFTETDNLLLAVFTAFPGPPAGFTTVLRADLEFPVQAILNNLAPADYIVFACYDRGGDNIMDCGDSPASIEDGDIGAFYNEQAPVTVAADTVTTLGLDLETGNSADPNVQSTAEAGCQL